MGPECCLRAALRVPPLRGCFWGSALWAEGRHPTPPSPGAPAFTVPTSSGMKLLTGAQIGAPPVAPILSPEILTATLHRAPGLGTCHFICGQNLGLRAAPVREPWLHPMRPGIPQKGGFGSCLFSGRSHSVSSGQGHPFSWCAAEACSVKPQSLSQPLAVHLCPLLQHCFSEISISNYPQ